MPVDLQKHCWTTDLHPSGESFTKSIPSQLVLNNRFYLTIDFPSRTYVHRLNYNSNSILDSSTMYNVETIECSISRYDPGIKLTFSVCFDDKLK
jgi:hypothetical protein